MNTPTTTPRHSGSAGLSLLLITVGTLAAIWAGVWYYYLKFSATAPADWTYYVCTGTFLSGVALVTIGGLVGYIGRSAKQADNPPMATPAPAAPAAGATPVATGPVVSATGPATNSPPRVAVPQQVQQS